MRILIVETTPVGSNNVTVHVRNAMIIADYLVARGHVCQLVWDEAQIQIDARYDIILFASASFYFRHEKFSALIDNNKSARIGWLTNDYELFMNDFLKGRIHFLIGAFDKTLIKKAHQCDKYLQIKLNTLIVRDVPTVLEKTRGMCYYGTFRKYRVPYFKKWLNGEVILSSSKKNWDKFAQIGCEGFVTTQFNWAQGQEQLARFDASLYIEDTKSHDFFCSFANRFFEALNCNVLPVFDKSCLGTIQKETNYWVPDSLVAEPDSWRAQIASVDKDRFLQVNRDAAIQEKRGALESIEKFLTTL